MEKDGGLDLDSIGISITASMVCSNLNRLCILYLLRECDENCMQAEKIASTLRISHRTVLYHLDILKDYGLVEVKEFRKKGSKLLRSVWGLSSGKGSNVPEVFAKIGTKVDLDEVDRMVSESGSTAVRKRMN